MDITHAESFKEKLSKAVERSNVVELKADKVERADTAGLQILVSLNRELRRRGGKIVWKNPSDDLLAVIKILGLAPYLELESDSK